MKLLLETFRPLSLPKPVRSACLRLRCGRLPSPGHVFFLQQHRVLQRGRESGDFRRDARERDVRGDPRKPVDEEQRRDPEEGSRDQTLHHQPEGCGEVHQICGHGSEPSLHPGEPQVRTPTTESLLPGVTNTLLFHFTDSASSLILRVKKKHTGAQVNCVSVQKLFISVGFFIVAGALRKK